jgi:hypothetical protein
MKRIAWMLLLTAVAALAAPPLFKSPTESTWTVTFAGKGVATVTVLTDGKNVRAEWKGATGAPAVFIGTGGKLWLKQTGGDIELAGAPAGVEKQVVPALLLPYLADPKEKTTLAGGKVATYAYATSTAAYTWDDKGPTTIEVKSGTKAWTLARKSLAKPSSTQATLFAVQPKKTASTRLASVAGGLLGPADRSVSATAGGRGVEKGAKFADGGDYDALAKLEARDEAWSAKIGSALEKFQKDGKVGEARGGDR